jgi:hypothetical protein
MYADGLNHNKISDPIMKKQFRRWSIRIAALGAFVVLLLAMLVLNPGLSYAHSTKYSQFTIYHNKPVDPAFENILHHARALSATGSYFNPALHLDVCLNDGSRYPGLIRCMQGEAFAWGFYNKVVLSGEAHFSENYVSLNGYRWNATQLLAHEMTHCYQFSKRGLWQSNPVARIPTWIWEGYAEYIARQQPGQCDLRKNYARYLHAQKTRTDGWIQFEDGSGTVDAYYRSWMVVQFQLNIRGRTYDSVINANTAEAEAWKEMEDWLAAPAPTNLTTSTTSQPNNPPSLRFGMTTLRFNNPTTPVYGFTVASSNPCSFRSVSSRSCRPSLVSW